MEYLTPLEHYGLLACQVQIQEQNISTIIYAQFLQSHIAHAGVYVLFEEHAHVGGCVHCYVCPLNPCSILQKLHRLCLMKHITSALHTLSKGSTESPRRSMIPVNALQQAQCEDSVAYCFSLNPLKFHVKGSLKFAERHCLERPQKSDSSASHFLESILPVNRKGRQIKKVITTERTNRESST